MRGDPICGNCGGETPTLAPCPCGFDERCPVLGGLCDLCYQMILMNAINLRKERVRDRS